MARNPLLDALSATAPHLENYQAGLERESMRITPTGQLAPTSHPISLGSALTHPLITTDFAEAQLELVTPPFPHIDTLLHHAEQLHAFVAQHLAAEQIWPASMPPHFASDADIAIATFGNSAKGRFKETYRIGLVNRYGKHMQAISGIHFNYSFGADFWTQLQAFEGSSEEPTTYRTRRYFDLLRNYLRCCWILTYLFGVSPAVDRSFLPQAPAELESHGDSTLYGPWATSLRMSRVGYVNTTRCKSHISYNGLDAYVQSMHRAITHPCKDFAKLGVMHNDAYLQLNDHILQIENEHYSLIRPKQPPRDGERPLTALRDRGIDYIEVRAVDVSPFSPIGVDAQQLHFIRLLLVACLLQPSAPLERADEDIQGTNQHKVALLGRQPGLTLNRNGQEIALTAWATEIIQQLQPIAETLDALRPTPLYGPILAQQQAKVDDPTLTPSAQVLTEILAAPSFQAWGLARSNAYAQTLRSHILPPELLAQWQGLVSTSLQAQVDLDAEPGDFAAYLADYAGLLQAPVAVL